MRKKTVIKCGEATEIVNGYSLVIKAENRLMTANLNKNRILIF